MTDEKKKDNKDRKKLSDEELEDVAGGTADGKGNPPHGRPGHWCSSICGDPLESRTPEKGENRR